MVMVLDRDGYPGQKRGMSLAFTVISSTRVLDNERPAGADAIQVQRQAVVKYFHGNAGALVAREIRVVGGPRGGSSGNSGYGGGGGNGGGAGGLQPIERTFQFREVRLQRTPRQGDAHSEKIKAGADFYIGFYMYIDAKAPLDLVYRCMNPDLSGEPPKGGKRDGLRNLGVCDYKETIPAGFNGPHYRVFTMKYAADSPGRNNLMIAEVGPVFRRSNGNTVENWQRKVVPITLVK